MDPLQTKYNQLQEILRNYGNLLVAFSGGVDSAFLLAAAREALGERVLAATAHSAVHPSYERRDAASFCESRGIRHRLVASREMDDPDFRVNSAQRCYICKSALFRQLRELAETQGIDHIAHGANCDDLKDYRPGHKAAEEHNIDAPLVKASWHKAEIREMSARMGLPTWDLPAQACLATRIPYGQRIDNQSLKMIENAEALLHELGFRQCRVRHHGTIARVELEPGQFERVMAVEVRRQVVEGLCGLGFLYVSLDLAGYRSGGLNVEIRSSG